MKLRMWHGLFSLPYLKKPELWDSRNKKVRHLHSFTNKSPKNSKNKAVLFRFCWLECCNGQAGFPSTILHFPLAASGEVKAKTLLQKWVSRKPTGGPKNCIQLLYSNSRILVASGRWTVPQESGATLEPRAALVQAQLDTGKQGQTMVQTKRFRSTQGFPEPGEEPWGSPQ